MIVKPYVEPPPLRDPREHAGAKAEEQMAHYLHRKFRVDPAVCVLHQLRIEDGDQPEQDGSPGVCQIDHLVVHRWGFFLVESKSVAEEVQVRPDGDGGDEWSRTYRGEQHGIPSPIRQAERQSDLLRNLLHRHRRQLVGKKPLGLRSIARVFGWGDHRGFRYAPMQLVVAVSDSGRICRVNGWRPQEIPFRVTVTKADLVPEKIERELDRHRTSANPFRAWQWTWYGVWQMKADELRRVAEFLAERHVDRSVGSPMSTESAPAATGRGSLDKIRAHHPRAYEPWSREDDHELLRLCNAGWNHAQLAERFGRQPSAIKSRLRKLTE